MTETDPTTAAAPAGRPRSAADRRDELRRQVTRAVEDRAPGTTVARAVCAAAVRLVPELEAVAVTLRTPGGAAHVLAASHPWARCAEDLQYTAGEGPGVTAFTERREVIVPDLAASARWPGFTDAASRIGVAGVLAFPLPDPVRLGTLTWYRRRSGAPGGAVRADARTLAALAAAALTRDDLLDQVSRDGGYADVHVATGMLSVALRVTTDEAYARLRAAAFSRDTPLLALARAVLADPHQGRRLLDG